jgi:hypothetical protein
MKQLGMSSATHLDLLSDSAGPAESKRGNHEQRSISNGGKGRFCSQSSVTHVAGSSGLCDERGEIVLEIFLDCPREKHKRHSAGFLSLLNFKETNSYKIDNSGILWDWKKVTSYRKIW